MKIKYPCPQCRKELEIELDMELEMAGNLLNDYEIHDYKCECGYQPLVYLDIEIN